MTTGTTTRRVAFFTFGKGSGDLVVGIAIANAFRRAGLEVSFTCFTDNEFPQIAGGFADIVTVPLEPRLFLVRDERTRLYRELTRYRPDLLFVYGSWLPVYPVLDRIPGRKVLLLRQCSQEWLHVRSGPIELDINPRDYDAAYCIEPGFDVPGFERLPPVVIRNREEILPRDEARRRLGVPDRKRLVVIARNGYEGELEELLRRHGDAGTGWHRLVTTNKGGAGIFPLADYAAAIDLLISGGGYSTFYETRYFGIPAQLYPFDRNAEDIAWRLRTNARYTFDENGADVLVSRVRGLVGV